MDVSERSTSSDSSSGGCVGGRQRRRRGSGGIAAEAVVICCALGTCRACTVCDLTWSLDSFETPLRTKSLSFFCMKPRAATCVEVILLVCASSLYCETLPSIESSLCCSACSAPIRLAPKACWMSHSMTHSFASQTDASAVLSAAAAPTVAHVPFMRDPHIAVNAAAASELSADCRCCSCCCCACLLMSLALLRFRLCGGQ